jgi:hypothetical protein
MTGKRTKSKNKVPWKNDDKVTADVKFVPNYLEINRPVRNMRQVSIIFFQIP